MKPKLKRTHPNRLVLASCHTEFAFVAAAAGEPAKRPTFRMTAYDGKPMRVNQWSMPVVIDYDGLTIDASQTTIRREHYRLVGHATSVELRGKKLMAEGVISFENDDAEEIVAAARNGFPWQASVGVMPSQVEYLPPGTTTQVNGMAVKGPLDIVRKGTLQEISFVERGASGGTKATVAASANGGTMDPEELQNGTTAAPADDQTPVQGAADDAGEKKVEASAPKPERREPSHEDAVKDIRATAVAETRRIAAVQAAAKDHPEIAAQAIDAGWDLQRTKDAVELKELRAGRVKAPGMIVASAARFDAQVIEAAMCAGARLGDLEKRFDQKTLEAAHKQFRGTLGVQELLIEAARAAGWSGARFRGEERNILQAAFSTASLPGILSNVANKFLLQGFMAVEQVWRQVATVRPVSDFKTVTSYRLNGSFEYDEVGANGELTHATPSEQSYTNRAKTYGKMFALTRTDIINDDLGALTAVPMRIGRGAALKLNKVFWQEFLSDAAFFTTGNKNYFAGAATNLQLSSLTTAVQMFRDQTDPDGNPLALAPKLLLVPTALETTAKVLMQSTEVRDTTANTKIGTANPFAGNFSVLVSTYLSNTAISGGSSTAWYLLANPLDLALIEVAFLNGVEEPTVESAEADFNTLGIQMRGYHDFGVSKQEPRAAVKSKGAA